MTSPVLMAGIFIYETFPREVRMHDFAHCSNFFQILHEISKLFMKFPNCSRNFQIDQENNKLIGVCSRVLRFWIPKVNVQGVLGLDDNMSDWSVFSCTSFLDSQSECTGGLRPR
jgi:hypothetical protein